MFSYCPNISTWLSSHRVFHSDQQHCHPPFHHVPLWESKTFLITLLQALSEGSLHYFISLISGMNVAYNFSNEGLSQGFIYNAAIKGRLRNKPYLQFSYVLLQRGVVWVSCYEFSLGGLGC